jgi:predicted HicB family RNase H-like nuclease
MSAMRHKGYSARIEYDDEDGVFRGKIAGIRDVVSFHATNVGDLRAAFREAVADYLATCVKIGRPPQKAFSGQMMLRVDPEIHAKAALAAELAGKSLNQWSEEALAHAANKTIAA